MSARDQITGRAVGGLEHLVDQVRADARHRGALGAAQTFATLDGEVTIDWREDDWVRITFSGDGRERTYVLSPSWPDV
jgi:hypothetical protein